MLPKETIDKLAEKIWVWLQEEHLHITMANIERFFALKHPKAEVSEKEIKYLWNKIGDLILIKS